MAEDISRRPIDPDEFEDDGGVDLHNQLQQAHNIQRDLGRTIPEDPDTKPVIKGRLPPHLQAKVEQVQKQQARPVEQEFPRQQRPEPQATKQYAPQFDEQRTTNFTAAGMQTNNKELADIIKMLDTNKYEPIQLPSLGKFYSGSDGPTDGVLHIRPMTGKEEMILAQPRYLKKGIALDMVFESCCQEKFQSSKLLSIDRTYLLIMLRGISHGNTYDVQVRCPECSTQFSTEIDLNLPVELCPESFTNASLEGRFPTSGLRFRYRLATGNDDLAVQEHQERRVKQFGASANDDTVMFRMSLLCESIEGVKGSHLIQEVIERLPISDVNYLRNLITDPPFGVNTKVGLVCAACGREFEVALPMEASFFFPQTKKETKKSLV